MQLWLEEPFLLEVPLWSEEPLWQEELLYPAQLSLLRPRSISAWLKKSAKTSSLRIKSQVTQT